MRRSLSVSLEMGLRTTSRHPKRMTCGWILLALAAGCCSPRPAPPATTPSSTAIRREHAGGRVLILPGVSNERFQLAGLAAQIREAYPLLQVEIRPWGPAFLSLSNLAAFERNRQTAQALANELADYRRAHPRSVLVVIGYSGGGGIAVLLAEALPDDVTIDRLILVAPAISRNYPIEDVVLPHVAEFMVNFASAKDFAVGWGTAHFGTIDRKWENSAGSVGFAAEHPRLVEWHWSKETIADGHYGNHLSYLGRRWQRTCLLPVLDPAVDAAILRANWSTRSAGETAP
jgi:pimeloyl-ACP methyl ester carboxylesterase